MLSANRKEEKMNRMIRQDVETAMISALEKQSVECMTTEKLNILKRSRVAVMHLLSQTTSRQLVTA